MFKITPKSEADLAMENLLTEGKYPFEVREAFEEMSKDKPGKPSQNMLHLKLTVFSDTRNFFIDDYIVESAAWKLRHFYDSIGLISEYEAGNISADSVVGKTGICSVKIDDGKKSGYRPSNKIGDYTKVETKSPSEQKAAESKQAEADEPGPF